MRYFLVIFITVLFSLQAVGQQNVSPVQVSENDKMVIPFGHEVADSTIKKGMINLLHIYKENEPDTTVQRFETLQKKVANRIFTWIDMTIPFHVFKTDQAKMDHVVSYLQEESGRDFEAQISDSLPKNQIRETRILYQQGAKP